MDAFALLSGMAVNLVTEYTSWLGKRSLKQNSIELAILATSDELKDAELYSRLCTWCQSEGFKELLNQLSNPTPPGYTEFEEDFVRTTGTSTDESKRTVTLFARHLHNEIIKRNPIVLDERAASRHKELTESIAAMHKQLEEREGAVTSIGDSSTDSQTVKLLEAALKSFCNEHGIKLTTADDAEVQTADVKANATPEPGSESMDVAHAEDEPWPTYWRKEPFSTFLAASDRNTRLTSLQYPQLVDTLQRLHYLDTKLNAYLEGLGVDYAALFLMRGHSTILAATRLGLSGQFPESYSQLYNTIHQTLYALFLSLNRRETMTYLLQNESPVNKNRALHKFRLSELLHCLKKQDKDLYNLTNFLFKTCQSFGCVGEIFEIVGNIQFGNPWTFHYMGNSDIHFEAAIKMIARVQICRFLIVDCIYPEFFKKDELANELHELMVGL